MKQPSFRDAEQLSAYLDGKLNAQEAGDIKNRLAGNPELHSVYQQLAQARSLLKKLPQRRAPKNFTLSRQTAGIKPPVHRLFPTFRFASALASLLLVAGLATNGFFPAIISAQRAAEVNNFAFTSEAGMSERPMGGGGGDPEASAPEAALAAPAAEEPAAETTADQTQKLMPPSAEQSTEMEAASSPATPIEAPIPTAVLALTLAIASLSGLTAYLLNWLNERNWKTKK